MGRPRKDPDSTPFNERVSQLRRELGMNQQELAEKVDVSQIQVSKYERGLGYPSIDTLILLAHTLNTTTDYLLGLTDDPYTESNTASIPPDVIELLRDRDEAFYQLLRDMVKLLR